VLWLGCTGEGWRDLPPHLGHWHRVYVRFARCRESGVWERAAHWLIAHNRRLPHARQRQVQLDSTSIRVHQHAAGAAKKRAQAVGRSRGGRTSKLHLSCDGAGNVLNCCLTPGLAGDCPRAAGPEPSPGLRSGGRHDL
jgi:transposase